LEEVSIHLRSIFSNDFLDTYGNKDSLKTTTLFFTPTQHPLIMMKSSLTGP